VDLEDVRDLRERLRRPNNAASFNRFEKTIRAPDQTIRGGFSRPAAGTGAK
jgi:hypothetical protein